MSMSLLLTGDIALGKAHCDQTIKLYDPTEHRPLATRFGQDVLVAALSVRSLALYLLGYPEAARGEADKAVQSAREIGQVTSLMYALTVPSGTYVHPRDYLIANVVLDEAVALADERGTVFWSAWAAMNRGCAMVMSGSASEGTRLITSGMATWRSTGATALLPTWLSYLAKAYAELGRFDDAWACINEAMTTAQRTKETWFEADIQRIAGEIVLLSPAPTSHAK